MANKSKSSSRKRPCGKFTEWRMVVTEQRKQAHDILNELLQKNGFYCEDSLTMAIVTCEAGGLISQEESSKLTRINENGKIARHEWTQLSESIMIQSTVVYTSSVFEPTFESMSYLDYTSHANYLYECAIQDVVEEPSVAEIQLVLHHRDLIHILRQNGLPEQGGFMKCLNLLKTNGLVSDEQYESSKIINKKGCNSKHPVGGKKK